MRLLRQITTAVSVSILLLLAAPSHAAENPWAIPVQITHAQNYDPSPSPDGKRLVFISTISGKEQLYTINVDGSQAAQVTHDDADHEDPAWSPDGTRIAFVLIAGGHNRIATMRVDGSNVEVVTPPEQNTIHPNWSSDGRKIIYCTNDDLEPPKKNTSEIYFIDLTSKKVTPIITGGINTFGSWSPDMRHVVFRKLLGEQNSEVFVANSDGSNQRNLTNNPFFDGWPAWSPDGKKIAFASNRRSHGFQIFVMNADGSNVQLVANTEGRATVPHWSRDGKTVYFTNCVEKDYGADCEILAAKLDRE